MGSYPTIPCMHATLSPTIVTSPLVLSSSLKTLFVDPPRSGLDPESVELMATFDRIVYISCNPETLHANLKGVAGVTHDVVRFAAFDQFPFTHHLEAGVYLVRKNHPSVTL